MNPQELLYTAEHEWVHVADDGGNKVATIGISKFAIEQLTDIVYVGLPDVGAKLDAKDELCEVESVKAVSPIYAPVAGEITEVNSDLPENMEWFQDSPYEKAWIAKLRITDESALAGLMDYAAYEKQCAEQG